MIRTHAEHKTAQENLDQQQDTLQRQREQLEETGLSAEAPENEKSAEGFFVEDDGPGIPEEKREKVLETGYTTTEDGTGLGLSIAWSVADSHGWDLSITDGREGGARFEIREAQVQQ